MMKQVKPAAEVAMIQLAAESYRRMLIRNRADKSSYADWRIFYEMRHMLVYTLGYMTWEQFGAVMEELAAEYKSEEEAI